MLFTPFSFPTLLAVSLSTPFELPDILVGYDWYNFSFSLFVLITAPF